VFAGRFEKAITRAETALSENPVLHMGSRAAALTCARAGDTEPARGFMAGLPEIDPALRASNLQDQTLSQRAQDVSPSAPTGCARRVCSSNRASDVHARSVKGAVSWK
jgi:hypothetical protein